MKTERIALLLMAGGRSERFGASDKLTTDLGGMALGLHTAKRLSAMTWGQKIAVVQGGLIQFLSGLGFNILEPAKGVCGLGDNLAVGAQALGDVDAVLILLADMPFVTRDHADRLISALSGDKTMAMSGRDGKVSPPAALLATHFKALQTLSGDEGARRIIMSDKEAVAIVEADETVLLDCDTPEAVDYARTRLTSREDNRWI